MRYIWTIIWSFLLTNMMYYVVGNMSGAGYDFNNATTISLFVSVLVFILGDGIIGSEETQS